jgi:hypothetical protein
MINDLWVLVARTATWLYLFQIGRRGWDSTNCSHLGCLRRASLLNHPRPSKGKLGNTPIVKNGGPGWIRTSDWDFSTTDYLYPTRFELELAPYRLGNSPLH